MPSIITHGLVALALAAKPRENRTSARMPLLIGCILCAMLPDLDYIGFKMGVQYNSLFGHRGFTHSIFFAALVAAVVSWGLRWKFSNLKLSYWKLGLLFFTVTVSHSLLDAITDGGEGIAFFSPFSNHRYFFPYRPIMVSPLGVGAFFSWRGLLVLGNELLLVIFPLVLVLYFPELLKNAKAKWLAGFLMLAGWLTSLAALNGLYPLNNIFMTAGKSGQPVIDLYLAQYKNAHGIEAIPTLGIPGGKLIANFLEFQNRGLFNRRLETRNLEEHWASGFFSNWYGGIAGRWQDPNYQLLLRTFLGFNVAGSREILDVLKASNIDSGKKKFLFGLSPTEKYDLALGDYDFTSTKSVLGTSHNANALPRFWFGICNGMAAASKWYAEPFRTVDVVNPNGFKIRFHPNDVKALLGFAMAEVSQWGEMGVRCNVNGPEADKCRINPGAFFLATMNRIALAHDSFIADAYSGTRKQFYLFDAVRVEVLKSPKPAEEMKNWVVPTPVKYLAEVRFTMDFVSTLLSDKIGDLPDETSKREGSYKKVGRVVVPRVLDAVIAINKDGNVIGGGWLGDEDVPDVVFFPSHLPAKDQQSRLTADPKLNWAVIKQIYDQSISESPDRPPVDFSL